MPPETVRVCEYATSTAPAGSGEELLIVSAGGLIVSENVLLVLAPALSATCAVKLKLPALVGVPLKTPPVVKLNPAAKVPAVTDHENGAVPFVTVNVKEYGVPTIALGSGDGEVIVTGAPPGTVKSTTSVGALTESSRVA